MRTEYKRDMNHNYLILHGEGEMDTGSYQVRMLVGNGISSLLNCRVQEMDGNFSIYYDITSRHSLVTMYEDKKFELQDLKLIFGSFIQVMEEMSEYLLNPGQLLISPEYMYLDAEKKRMYFCCFPGQSKDVREQFQALTEYVLPKIDHNDGQAVILGYGIYRKALEDSFHLEYIKEELYRTREEELPGLEENFQSPPEETERMYEEIINHGANFQTGADIERNSRAEKKRKEKNDGKERRRIGKRILICALYAGILLAVIAAGAYGFLPGISVEAVLGIAVVGMGAGMLAYVIWKKLQKQPTAAGKKKEIQAEEERLYEEEKNLPESGQPGEQKNLREKETLSGKGIRQEGQAFIKADSVKRIFPGREIVSNYGETMVLSANPVQGPATLVSREPGELATIYLQEEITVVGKLETAADVVLDLPTVSRMHARIRRRGGEYYLSDLNSRNGTAVNGRLLQDGEDYCLQEQDEVDFAQARYVFLK